MGAWSWAWKEKLQMLSYRCIWLEHTHHWSICKRCIQKLDHRCPGWWRRIRDFCDLYCIYNADLNVYADPLWAPEDHLLHSSLASECTGQKYSDFFSPSLTTILLIFLCLEGLLFTFSLQLCWAPRSSQHVMMKRRGRGWKVRSWCRSRGCDEKGWSLSWQAGACCFGWTALSTSSLIDCRQDPGKGLRALNVNPSHHAGTCSRTLFIWGLKGYQQLICDQEDRWKLHKAIACSGRDFTFTVTVAISPTLVTGWHSAPCHCPVMKATLEVVSSEIRGSLFIGFTTRISLHFSTWLRRGVILCIPCSFRPNGSSSREPMIHFFMASNLPKFYATKVTWCLYHRLAVLSLWS